MPNLLETEFHFHPGAVIDAGGVQAPPCPTPDACFICNPAETAPSGLSCVYNATCDECDDALCPCPDCVWIDEPLAIELAR